MVVTFTKGELMKKVEILLDEFTPITEERLQIQFAIIHYLVTGNNNA